jgi:hypothetical protein
MGLYNISSLNASSDDRKKLWDPCETLGIINCAPGYQCITCMGYAPSQRRRCRNPIRAENRGFIMRTLNEIAYLHPDSPVVMSKLRAIAGPALCVRYHQNQAKTVLQQWQENIQSVKLRIAERIHTKTVQSSRRKESEPAEALKDAQEQLREMKRLVAELQEELKRQRQEDRQSEDHRREKQEGECGQEEDRGRKERERQQREERDREARRQEEEREEKERQEEERLKKEREEKERQEQQRREKEQQEREQKTREQAAHNERIRQRAQKAREERERKEHEKSQKEREEWDQAWKKYTDGWTAFRGRTLVCILGVPFTDIYQSSVHFCTQRGEYSRCYPMARQIGLF